MLLNKKLKERLKELEQYVEQSNPRPMKHKITSRPLTAKQAQQITKDIGMQFK
jgi:hypothetical protein